MANPSVAELDTQLTNACALLEKIRLAGMSQTGNVVSALDTLTQDLEGDYASAIAAAAEGIRSRYAGLLNPSQISGVLNGIIRQYAIAIGSAETEIDKIITDLYDYFHDNSKTLQSRGFTRGAVSKASGFVGSGTILRVTVDADGYDIETGEAQVITAECVKDDALGTDAQAEQWQLYGTAVGIDALAERGTGKGPKITTISQSDAASYITNPSFEQVSPKTSGSTVSTLTSWTESTSTVTSGMTISLAQYYRGGPGITTPIALKWMAAGAGYIEQDIGTLSAAVPYLAQVAYKGVSGATPDGNLILTVGSYSVTAALAAASSGAGWKVLRMALTSGNPWPKNFVSGGSAKFRLTISSTSGGIYIDDAIMAPFTAYKDGGGFYAAIGAATKFAYEDKATFTDTVSGSIIQRMFVRAYNRYMPSAASGSISDPTVT